RSGAEPPPTTGHRRRSSCRSRLLPAIFMQLAALSNLGCGSSECGNGLSLLLRRGRAGLLARGTVLGAGLPAFGNALAVEDAPDDMVADAGQVADASAPHQDDRVLLQVVPLAADVGGDLLAVGEPDSRHLAQRRVGLLGGHRLDLEAHALLERG